VAEDEENEVEDEGKEDEQVEWTKVDDEGKSEQKHRKVKKKTKHILYYLNILSARK
jgi:hypothetical protein